MINILHTYLKKKGYDSYFPIIMRDAPNIETYLLGYKFK